jgi:hypothetical protein
LSCLEQTFKDQDLIFSYLKKHEMKLDLDFWKVGKLAMAIALLLVFLNKLVTLGVSTKARTTWGTIAISIPSMYKPFPTSFSNALLRWPLFTTSFITKVT